MPVELDPIERLNELAPSEFMARYLPLDSPLLTIKSNDDQYKISVKALVDMESEELQSCFELIKETSMDDYRNSSRGWKPKAKQREMRETGMWYLLVRRDLEAASPPEPSTLKDGGSSPILAFMSYMFTYEDGYPVVYVYEIHLASQLRRKGIGTRLLDIVEHVAQQTGVVAKLMLSVFLSNERARAFYKQHGFSVDEYSPGEKRLRNGVVKKPDYQILSKPVENNKLLESVPEAS